MDHYLFNLGYQFRRVAIEYGDRIALSFPNGQEYTYRQLDSLSDVIAAQLSAKGLRKGMVCAIAGVKQFGTYAAFIACIKRGIIYTFFDPEGPVERVNKIFARCKPTLVLGYKSEIMFDLSLLDHQLHDLSQIVEEGTTSDSASGTNSDVCGNNPAYIMFTSGSTGFPKGAVMTHDNISNFINWARDTFEIKETDIFTNINPLYFDNSVFDLYASLFSGATLVPISKKESLHPATVLRILEEKKCSNWFSVPSMLIYLQTSKAIIPERWKNVKKIVFGGEGYPKAKLVNLFNALRANTRIYNVYGPTECTCICSCYEVSATDFEELNGFLPLGYIAPNFSFQIVDENGASTREKGELLLGGPNVGLGYYNDQDRTRDRFIQNPQHSDYEDIFYRTGDLVSFDDVSGYIQIHGRTDNQIKHMGYRIELEEIENVMCQVDGIDEAAAFILESTGGNRIAAVYESSNVMDADQLKQVLKNYLPSYMIPSLLKQVDRISKNANGKTDRLSLSKTFT